MAYVNPTNVRFRKTADRVVRHFRNDAELRLYPAKYEYLMESASEEWTWDKQNYIEFFGVLYSTTSDTLTEVYNSKTYDIGSLHKLITSQDIEFHIRDRISESDVILEPLCYEIVQVDNFIGYQTLILERRLWK